MKALILSLLAGLVCALGFQPAGLWPLSILAVAALIHFVRAAPGLRSALAMGWCFGLGYFTLGLNWIATSFTYQSNMPAWLGWIAVVLLSLYLAVYPAIAAGLGWRWGRRDPLRLALIFAGGWIVSEWLRATMFTGFAWNPLGVALLPTPVAVLATVIGTYGLSGIAVLLSALLLLLIERRWRDAAILAVPILFAAGLLAIFRGPTPAATSIAIRLVQPNIGQDQKWVEGAEERNFERLAGLSTKGSEPRLLLWPEAAVTLPLEDGRIDPYYRNAALMRRVQLAELLGPGDLLLTGGVTVRSKNGVDATSATNSIFAIDRRAQILARYDKAHLVPYGEYLPMRPLLSRLGLSRLAPGDIDFDPGPGPQTLRLPLVGRVGFQLCYEIIFSGEVVDRHHRPGFLFNPSNDAWFGSWGPPQHLAQARLRALEEGLPVLRSTPTGISAVIDADGRLIEHLGWHQAGFIDARLPAPRAATPFAQLGNILSLLFALLLAGAAIAVRRFRS